MGICGDAKIPKRQLTSMSQITSENEKKNISNTGQQNEKFNFSSLIGLNDLNDVNLKNKRGSFIYNKQVEYKSNKNDEDEDLLEKVLYQYGTDISHKEIKYMLNDANVNNDGLIDYRQFVRLLLNK